MPGFRLIATLFEVDDTTNFLTVSTADADNNVYTQYHSQATDHVFTGGSEKVPLPADKWTHLGVVKVGSEFYLDILQEVCK